MTHKAANYKYAGIAILMAGIFALAFYYGTLFYKRTDPGMLRQAPEKFVTFEGFPEDTQVEANFIRDGKATPLLVSNGEFVLPETIKQNFFLPYNVKAVFRTPDNQYFDFTFSINWRGVEYNIAADGFSPDDKASLFFGESRAKTVSFDWSGKIEFPVILPQDDDKTVCIQTMHGNETFSLCHSLTGKAKA